MTSCNLNIVIIYHIMIKEEGSNRDMQYTYRTTLYTCVCVCMYFCVYIQWHMHVYNSCIFNILD